MSMSCATKSSVSIEAFSRTSVSGDAAWNRSRRGKSHLAAKAGLTVTVSTPFALPSLSRATPRLNRSNPARMSGRARRAASVSASRVRPLVPRWNSGVPSESSRLRTSCPTAAGVTCSSAAAAEKLSCRALASKARRAFR
jgi:hypothetical protein